MSQLFQHDFSGNHNQFFSLCACVTIVFYAFMGFEPATEDK